MGICLYFTVYYWADIWCIYIYILQCIIGLTSGAYISILYSVFWLTSGGYISIFLQCFGLTSGGYISIFYSVLLG